MSRKAAHLNWRPHLSDDEFQIFNRTDNAQVVGANYGWFALKHDLGAATVTVYFLLVSDQDVDSATSESTPVAASSLPDIITDDGGNPDVTFSLYIDGVRS